MKVKKFKTIFIYIIHLLICLILSFDWSFLEGIYMGYGLTFLMIWGLTLPVVTALITILNVIFKFMNKVSIMIIETVQSVIGCIILLIYLASLLGLLNSFELSIIYLLVFGGTIMILISSCYVKFKKK